MFTLRSFATSLCHLTYLGHLLFVSRHPRWLRQEGGTYEALNWKHFCQDFSFPPGGRRSSKTFLLKKKLHKQPNMVTSNGSRPLQHHQKNHQVTNQKALRQAVQPSLQQKNHHTPDVHTVAPGLRTVFPPITNAEQSTVYQLSTLQALILRACNPHSQKNIFAKKNFANVNVT